LGLEPVVGKWEYLSMNIEMIFREALSLPVQERVQLAEQLLSSLDTLSEAEIEQLWFQEAARRAAEMDQGLVQRIPAEIVRREAQALLK
jgi:putative addiction module component (TIGR02574 family)